MGPYLTSFKLLTSIVKLSLTLVSHDFTEISWFLSTTMMELNFIFNLPNKSEYSIQARASSYSIFFFLLVLVKNKSCGTSNTYLLVSHFYIHSSGKMEQTLTEQVLCFRSCTRFSTYVISFNPKYNLEQSTVASCLSHCKRILLSSRVFLRLPGSGVPLVRCPNQSSNILVLP